MNYLDIQRAPSLDLSIIIISWNTRDLLANCLESVAADLHAYPLNAEILVVDNASIDGSAQMVRERFSWVYLFDNRDNVGFARANNQAIRACNGRYVLLLNPDTEVLPGALETLVRFMEGQPQVGAVGARHLNPDGTLQTSCYPLPTLRREFWRLLHLDALKPYGSYRMTNWNIYAPRTVEALLGACLLLRREALAQVGLLDEDYFIYSEEIDLCYRLQKAGWSLYWVPQAQVIHYGGQSTLQVASEMFLQLYQGKLLYFRKHHGWGAAQVYKLILFLIALPRLLLSPLAWLERQPQRRQHLTLAANYRRLIAALPTM